MTKKIKLLTKSEHQIMLYLWNLEKGGYTNAILSQVPEPKPAYTTLATFLKILTTKGFIKTTKSDNSKLFYTPKIKKEEYTRFLMAKNQDDFFDGSASKFIKFLINDNELTAEEKQEIAEMLK